MGVLIPFMKEYSFIFVEEESEGRWGGGHRWRVLSMEGEGDAEGLLGKASGGAGGRC